MVAEVASVGPGFEVGRRVDSDHEVLRVGDNHHPGRGWRVPDYLRIAELSAVDRDNGVVRILCEGVTAIEGVGNVLGFFFWGVEGVDRDHAVGLVGEEAGSVIGVYDCRAREYAFTNSAGVYGDGLICPVIEVL